VKQTAASRLAADAALLIVLKASTGALVLWSGFRAVSDDDYARVTIAQRFAESPTLDPSGTSWLPLPFYVYGGALRLFGSSLGTARGVAMILGLSSALLVLWAGRLLGLGRFAALLGAGVGAVFPYAAYLGVAMVPEAITAALAVLAAATLGTSDVRSRLLGAGALFAATAARYEPWALSALFAALSAWDAYKARCPRLLLAAAVALAFPVLWVLHGVFRHGDATFFVSRVSAYRAALGPAEPLLARVLHTPLAFIRGEPELGALCVFFALPVLYQTCALTRPPLRRFSLSLLAILALSLLADLHGTAATHHAERALFAVWLGVALLLGAAANSVSELTVNARRSALASAAVAALLGVLVRHEYPREPFVDRRSAVDIGALARREGVSRLGIDSGDYAFFAVQAGFGKPSASTVIDDHDPRKPRPQDLLARDARAFGAALSQARVSSLVLPRSRAPLAHSLGRVRGENADWALLQLSER
jgi:hypothetical protein